MKLSRIAPLSALLLVVPLAVPAHTMDVPASIMAGPDGSFSYTMTVSIGPDSAVVAGFGWNNGTNVIGAGHADCFCHPNCLVGPGETLQWAVEGALVDPEAPGTAIHWASFCDDADISAETSIQPFDPTAVEPSTWGRLKSLYR